MATNYEFYLESSIRGYHAYYKKLAETIAIGDILEFKIDFNNPHDQYAIVVKTFRYETAGHVPIEFSKMFWKFLSNYGEIEAECIGHRCNAGEGRGLELPVDYKFCGNEEYIRQVHSSLRRELDCIPVINITDIIESDVGFFRPVPKTIEN
eukprot:gene14735-16270_t